jgi:hypothetical protein
MSNHGSPVALLKLQIAPKFMLLISSGSKKKEPVSCKVEQKFVEAFLVSNRTSTYDT